MSFPNIELVRAVVRGLQATYLDKPQALAGAPMCLYEINNGLCEDFAQDVEARLRALIPAEHSLDEVLILLEPACLQKELTLTGELVWDAQLLDTVWGAPCPLTGTWESLSPEDFAQHVWVAVKLGPRRWLHFDAECPEGVPSFLQLPVFRRCLTDTWPTRKQVHSAPKNHIF